jgi:hypothetical protein
MIENIGFDSSDATHTTSKNKREADYKAASPYPLIHPKVLTVNEELEFLSMKNSGAYIRPLYRRILSKVKSLIVSPFQ